MDSDTTYEKAKKTITEFLSNSELKSYIKFKDLEVIYPGNIEHDIKLYGRVPKDKSLALDEFRETLCDILSEEVGSEYASQFIEDRFNVEAGMCEGDKFTGMELFDMDGKKVTVTHQSGQVLMLDFWATWCGYCQEPMQENVDLMSKNQNIQSKNISIVGLSCDEDTSKWKASVNQKNWGVLPQYVKAGLLKLCGIRGIPCVAVINKEGVIAYFGHPGGIKLEQTLLNLAEGLPVVSSEEENNLEQNAFWKVLDSQSKMDIVAESNFVIKDAGIINASFCVSTKISLDSNGNLVPGKITPIFYGEVTQFEYDTLQTVAITLQTNYSFDGFAFNVKVMEIGADEDF
jgi:thiol-disulfide isomerase/thioredoxin